MRVFIRNQHRLNISRFIIWKLRGWRQISVQYCLLVLNTGYQSRTVWKDCDKKWISIWYEVTRGLVRNDWYEMVLVRNDLQPSPRQKFENTDNPSLWTPLPKFDTLLRKPKSLTRFGFHVSLLPRGVIFLNLYFCLKILNKDFDCNSIDLSAAGASRLSLPHVVEPSDKILTHSQSRSMHRKRTYIISRLLEVKGDSVKIFNFYMSMKHSWRWTGLHMQSERIWADRRGNTLLGIKCLRQCLAAVAANRDKQF